MGEVSGAEAHEINIQGVVDSPERELVPGQPRVALLVISFIASFTLACSVLLVVGHYGLNAPRSLWPFGSSGVTKILPDDVAPFDSVQISRGGVYLKAAAGEAGNPSKGEDYGFFVWFKLRKLPAIGESLGLVGKFDSQLPGKPGYAVSLEGAPDGVRPRVYISAGAVPGRWYSFSSHPMNRRDWYLLTVTVVDDAFIATSLGRAFSEEPLILLGGHRLTGGDLPASKAEVLVGAFGASRFRGQVGPFGILSGPDSKEQLSSYFKAIQAQPKAIPEGIPVRAIRLWAAPLEDYGPLKVSITRVQGEARINDQSPKKAASVERSAADAASKPQRRITAPKKKVVKKSAKNKTKK
jgi:hypothetical protein